MRVVEPQALPAPSAVEEAPPKRRVPNKARDPNAPDLAVDLDLKLLQLFGERRMASSEMIATEGVRTWPSRMRSVWSRIVVYLDDALARPPGDYPVPLIVRTRVAVDTELDHTIAQHGKPPREIADGLIRVNTLLGRHLRSPDSPALETPGPELRLAWPLSPPLITSKFGQRVDPIADLDLTRFHAGLDLGASTGALVASAASGRVSFAGWLEGRGNTIVVQHGSGFVTLYAHLREFLVENGARVVAGTPVGLVGSSGRATGPHLHFEVRKRGVPVDPETLLPNP